MLPDKHDGHTLFRLAMLVRKDRDDDAAETILFAALDLVDWENAVPQ